VDLVPPQLDLAHGFASMMSFRLFALFEGAVGGAHDFDEIVAGDHVARFSVDDVSSRDCARRSSRKRWKNSKGLAMRQRA